MSPRKRAGRVTIRCELAHGTGGASTQINVADATTTQTAAVPGIGVFASNTKAHTSSVTSAAQPRRARATGATRLAAAGANASSAPAPNSQARAGVTK